LQWFGPEQPWQRLLDDQPILSGRHPLHLYHGMLGAAAMWQRGTLSCFDPAFQAGYPKTPVFDSGSRPAELFLGLAGGGYQPAAYKAGLALVSCAVPLVLALAAGGIGLGRGGVCLAAGFGMLVWWGEPCRCLIEAGDFEMLIAILAALLHAGLLLRYHRAPGVLIWLGLLATAGLGWFAHPLHFAIFLLPLLLAYYHTVGIRHSLPWHLALGAAMTAGVALNAFWLFDWIEFWSLRVPLPVGERLLLHRTIQGYWESSIWGGQADRLLALILLGSGITGVLACAVNRDRPAARLLALGIGGPLALALVGIAWEPLGRLDAPRLLVAALWFASVGSVFAWQWVGAHLAQWTGARWRAALLATAVLLVAGWLGRADLTQLAERGLSVPPLTLGLNAEQTAVVEAIRQHSDAGARILWEERHDAGGAGGWTALLPILTGRSFVGGLDADSHLEHAHAGLSGQQLAGQPLADWTDADLTGYCDRYNVGWIVCRCPATLQRLEQWARTDAAAQTATLVLDGEPAYLFTVHRERSYVIRGQARWLQADCSHIVLGDVVPANDGTVVLSLHYQAGMEVLPAQVRVEREPDPLDPVPFVRLRIPGPVARVILKWHGS
jgi:hypothetical protein